jgi:flagellar hook-basal body complex protein FliE
VLLLALPITVIGANFSREYDRVHGDKDERMVFKTLTELATLFHEESLVRAEGKRPDSSSSEHVFARVLTVASVLDNTKRVFMKERLKEKMERIKQQGRRKKEAARVAATEATARATKQPDKVNSKIIKSALSNSSSMHSKGDEDRSESPPLYRECFASASMKSGEFEDVIEESIDDMIRTLQDAKMKHRQMRLRRRGSSQIEAPVDS